MRVAIRYFSRGGNVKAMAEALSRGAGVEAISIDDPRAKITEPIDLLFIGGALYKFQLDSRFKAYLEDLPEGLISEAICFGSSMLTRRPIYLMQDYLKAKNIKISKQAIYSRNHPNESLIDVIEYFAENELTRDRSLDGLPPYMIFKKSEEKRQQREAEQAAIEAGEIDTAAIEAQKAAEEAKRLAQEAEVAVREAEQAAEAAEAEARARKAEAEEAARKAAEAAEAARAAESKAREARAEESSDSVIDAE